MISIVRIFDTRKNISSVIPLETEYKPDGLPARFLCSICK